MDLIHVKRWPVFNIADILVVCGIAVVVLAKRFGKERAGRGEEG